MFNAVTTGTLMFVRMSTEFFKPREERDRADTLHSYQYPESDPTPRIRTTQSAEDDFNRQQPTFLPP